MLLSRQLLHRSAAIQKANLTHSGHQVAPGGHRITSGRSSTSLCIQVGDLSCRKLCLGAPMSLGALTMLLVELHVDFPLMYFHEEIFHKDSRLNQALELCRRHAWAVLCPLPLKKEQAQVKGLHMLSLLRSSFLESESAITMSSLPPHILVVWRHR